MDDNNMTLDLVMRSREPDQIDREYFERGRIREALKAQLADIRAAYREKIKAEDMAMARLLAERADAETVEGAAQLRLFDGKNERGAG